MLRHRFVAITARKVRSGAVLSASVRLVGTGAPGKASSTNAADQAASAAPAKQEATPAEPPATETTESQQEMTPHSREYQFPTGEVFKAVRNGDMGKIQSTANELVQHKWKEEYTVPAACAVVFVILWYWVAWTRRSVRRKCEAAEAAVRQEAQETVAQVRSLTEKWGKDIAKSNEQMRAIIEKNSALTADIDHMTTALRSCSIRPTSNSSSAFRQRPATPTKQAVELEAVAPTLPQATSSESEDANNREGNENQ